MCEQFNRFINTLKKERQPMESKEKYPWLHASDEIKYMTDREILEKYIREIMLNRQGKEGSNGHRYKYKEVFSSKYEIGTSPNIEVEINITDKSPFLLDITT